MGAPTQADIEFIVNRARKRILSYLEKRGVVTFAATSMRTTCSTKSNS